MDLTTRVSLVQNLLTTKEIPTSVGARLLDINRTSIYYKGAPISDEELACKEIIDHLHTDNPTWGARQMSAQLKTRGYQVGRRKARRYMNEMDIYPIYPKMNLSKRMQQAKVCPYLLRNAVIDKPNQAWSIDITYIPIKRGFLYLTAVIDWYSRCIVGWEVDDTLDTRMVISVFCKHFLEKNAKYFRRMLHLQIGESCKALTGSCSASHKPLQIIFSCYSTRYGNGSSEFSSSCACFLK